MREHIDATRAPWRISAVGLICLIFLSSCGSDLTRNVEPRAAGGIIDLRTRDFEAQGSVALRGEWEFVYQRYLAPDAFTNDVRLAIVSVPAAWRSYTIAGKKLPTEGFATYRLRILTKPDLRLAFRPGAVAVAGRVYIDGRLQIRIGEAGTSRENTIPDRRASIIPIETHGDTLEVVIHVANFQYWKGGLLHAPVIGTREELLSSAARSMAYDISIIAGMLLFTITMVAFWLARRSDEVWLSFAMICASGLVRVAATGQRVVMEFVPGISWEWMLRLELGSFYVFFYSFYRAIYYLFPEEAKRDALIGARAVTVLTVAFTILTPARIHSMLVPGMQIMSVIGIMYALHASVAAMMHRREGAVMYFVIFLLTGGVMLAEMLFHSNVLPFMMPTMASILLLVQAMMLLLAKRYGRAFSRIETFADELEQKVDERTHELRAAQDALVHQEKMAALGQLTAGIAHEIKNPLNFVNNFAAVSVDLLEELPEDIRKRDDVASLLADLRDNLGRISQHGMRADSIVKAMMLHARGGGGERRSVDIRSLLDETADLAYHSARARMPDFNVTITRIYAPHVPPLTIVPQDVSRVFMNLIANAIDAVRARANGGGAEYVPTILLTADVVNDAVEVRVIDNGAGIPKDVAAKLFTPFFTTKSAGEGTGLGLSISHDIIVQGHGGALFLDTSSDRTEFVVRFAT